MKKDLYYVLDENKTGYYIFDKNDETYKIYQPEKYVLYKRDTIEESAQAHIDRILRDEAEAEKERISIEKLHKELTELKTLNSEQDDMLFEQSYEIAMLKLNTANAV